MYSHIDNNQVLLNSIDWESNKTYPQKTVPVQSNIRHKKIESYFISLKYCHIIPPNIFSAIQMTFFRKIDNTEICIKPQKTPDRAIL